MKKAVILVADYYQDLEVWYPLLRLKEAGWGVTVAGVESKKTCTGKYGYPIIVDTGVEEISADDFDAIVIPGGWGAFSAGETFGRQRNSPVWRLPFADSSYTGP